MRRAGLFLLLLALSGCGAVPAKAPSNAAAANAAQPPAKPTPSLAQNLDGLLAFKDPPQCNYGPALQDLLSNLVRYDENDQPVQGKLVVPDPYRAMVGKPKFTKNEDGLGVQVPIHGSWHGIDVTSLDIAYWEGGDPPAFAITMHAPLAAVRDMLTGLGFAVPSEAEKAGENEAALEAVYIDVSSQGDKTIFSCDYD